MNRKDRGRVRSFLQPLVPETKPSEFAGDGKALVFGGGIDIDADEKVLRIENARLETKVIAALDAQPQTACVFLRIDGDVAVPMLIDQSLCEGLGPVFFEPLLCKHFQKSLFDSFFPTIVAQKRAGEKGVRLRNDDGPSDADRRLFP